MGHGPPHGVELANQGASRVLQERKKKREKRNEGKKRSIHPSREEKRDGSVLSACGGLVSLRRKSSRKEVHARECERDEETEETPPSQVWSRRFLFSHAKTSRLPFSFPREIGMQRKKKKKEGSTQEVGKQRVFSKDHLLPSLLEHFSRGGMSISVLSFPSFFVSLS